MDVDVVNAIGAVRREVVERHHEGRPARAVVASRTYDTTPDDLWDAITNRDRVPRWFLPVSGDLRQGGHYQLEGNAGGTILECEPPRRLALTWKYSGEVSWVAVELAEDPGGGTHLRLEHLAPLGDERWDEFGAGAVGVGWDLGLLGLDEHVATGARVEGDTWAVSAQGKAFIRQSSDEWCAASIAAGTPEDVARAAAHRTTAAYTGEGVDEQPAGT